MLGRPVGWYNVADTLNDPNTDAIARSVSLLQAILGIFDGICCIIQSLKRIKTERCEADVTDVTSAKLGVVNKNPFS